MMGVLTHAQWKLKDWENHKQKVSYSYNLSWVEKVRVTNLHNWGRYSTYYLVNKQLSAGYMNIIISIGSLILILRVQRARSFIRLMKSTNLKDTYFSYPFRFIPQFYGRVFIFDFLRFSENRITRYGIFMQNSYNIENNVKIDWINKYTTNHQTCDKWLIRT